MRSLRTTLMRIRNLVGKTKADQDLNDELDLHLQMHIEDNIRDGMTPQEARRQALIAIGGLEQTKERHRDRRGIPIVEEIIQDLRYAARTMRKSPTFALAAVVTLGLAIGANTAIFSFADALAFRPPDVPRPGELVRIFSGTRDLPYGRMSYPDFLDFRSRTTTLSGVVAFSPAAVAMSRSRDELAQFVGALIVSDNYFSVLGVEPTPGRGFTDEDDRVPGARPVVVISRSLWTRSFQSDPAIVGREIVLGKRTFTIIGVAPPGFTTTELLEIQPDLYIPTAMTNAVAAAMAPDMREKRSERWLTVLGRLNPGMTASNAGTEGAALARSLEQTYPDTNRDRTAMALPEVTARERVNQGNQQLGGLLLGIVALVLLIACANVANLMLSHATGRTREIAVRLALGASRGRLIRQLLTEGLLLAAGGGLLGVLLAYGGVRYLSVMAQSILSNIDLRIGLEFRLDQRVLLFTLVTSLATSILFGLTPALRSTRLDLAPALKGAAGGATRRKRFTTRAVLAGSQVALSVVVLAVAGLSIRHFLDMRRTDPGFQTDHALLVSIDPGAVGYDQAGTRQFYDQLVRRIGTIPGVTAVGLAQSIPLSGINTANTTSVIIDGYVMPQGQTTLSIRSNVVDGGYWRAARTPILRGRVFDEQDTTTSPRVVIVNETMATRYWPGQEALGKTVRLESGSGSMAEVIGIVRDGKYMDIGEVQQPAIFIPFSQQNGQSMMNMVTLGAGDAASLTATVRQEMKALDPGVPAFNIRTWDNVFEVRALLPERLISQIIVSAGILALVLAVVGLYGVMAYLTSLRTREIGIRMALGADRISVLLMVLRQAAGMVGGGLGIGLVLAFFATPAFASAFNFAPRDLTMLAGVSLILTTAAMTASLIPARSAAMVNPTVALRDE